VLVDLIDVRANVGGSLGLQRRREHLPGAPSRTISSSRDELAVDAVVALASVLSWTTLSVAIPSRTGAPALVLGRTTSA
jgi:hypothetical protein